MAAARTQTETIAIAQDRAVVNQNALKALTAQERTMGRPTLYRPEYCDAILEYFEDGIYAENRQLAPVVTHKEDSKGSEHKTEVRHICAELPTFEGFAAFIGVSTRVLADWDRKHPDFLQARARCKDIQARLLVDRGLTRQYDSAAFTFVAKNMLGWTDKQQIETTVKAEDSDATNAVKQALASATPEQLAQFAQLIQAMQANAPAAVDPTGE